MKNDVVELIQRIHADDEAAFAELVNRYKKQVHALAWRKVGDFHIAEDITQEVFLKVFQQLHALRDPNLFSGWLYVITANLCATWHRKKRIQTQPLEDEEITMSEKDFYSQHVVEERTNTAVESHREVVRKLLAKLKESERTVMTLHYLGEMTVDEISKFIGVSSGTIKSRLQRARNRLQKEETMIREALEHFQLSPNLTDNIVKEVARLKPAAPTATKPFIPWGVVVSSFVLIVSMFGIASQFSARFQAPYSLDAQTETTVELIDAPLLQNVDVEPDFRRQLGSSDAPSNSNDNPQKPDDVSSAAAQDDGGDIPNPEQQWIEYEQSSVGGLPAELLATAEGELYTITTDGNFYKSGNGGGKWEHIIDMSSLDDGFWDNMTPFAMWEDTFYLVINNKLYASKDDGKNWDLVHTWEKAKDWYPSELVLTEKAFYVVFHEGTLRSEDQGKTWKDMSDEFQDGPDSFVVIQNTVVAASGTGLYRRDNDNWQRLEFPIPEKVYVFSLAGSGKRMYALVNLGPDFDPQAASDGRQRTWWLFRSTDLGDSWEDITPTEAWPVNGWPPGIMLIAAGENILLMEKGMVSSTDGGDTWLPPLQPDVSPSMQSFSPAVVVNDRVIYIGSDDGFKRSSDGGKSWDSIEIPLKRKVSRAMMDNLIASEGSDKLQRTRPSVYAKSWNSIVKTTDNGRSWKSVQLDVPMKAPFREEQPEIFSIIASDDRLYAKGERVTEEVNLYQISDDDDTLTRIMGVPTLQSRSIATKLNQSRSNPTALLDKSFVEKLKENSIGADQFFKELVELAQGGFQSHFFLIQRDLIRRGLNGAFAVSGDTFYLEYNFKLLRWTQGEREWYDTGVEETIGLTMRKHDGTFFPGVVSPAGIPKGRVLERARVLQSFKLAVSGNTVYVGKRDGHLVVSYDRGDSWVDITPRLPLTVIAFKDIKFAGSKVYAATDAGVTMSHNGTHWHAITDSAGENLVMEYLAVDGKWLYGITEKTGVYLLVNDTWEQIVSETPDKVTSLAVHGDTLYVGTQERGMLHFVFSK